MTFDQSDTKGDVNYSELLTEKEKKELGYDLYPERKSRFKPTLSGIFSAREGRETVQKLKCERKVYKQIVSSPIVKLMMGALKSSGCPIDIRRHISCEVCDSSVHGGYDPELNQIVICQNTANYDGFIQGILTHEMIHMFDACNHKFDFKNLDHLACTEIRAANLTHCSWFGGLVTGDFGPFNIRKAHQNCVKKKAYLSIKAVRNVSEEEAVAAVERVFDRCYNDLEPIGRRVRKSSMEAELAYQEGFIYGYV